LSNIGAKILDLAERDPEKAASYGFHLDSEWAWEKPKENFFDN
jgi:hypothetical protein